MLKKPSFSFTFAMYWDTIQCTIVINHCIVSLAGKELDRKRDNTHTHTHTHTHTVQPVENVTMCLCNHAMVHLYCTIRVQNSVVMVISDYSILSNTKFCTFMVVNGNHLGNSVFQDKCVCVIPQLVHTDAHNGKMVDWHTQAQVHTLTRPFLSSLNCSTLCAHHNFFLCLNQNASTHVQTLVTPLQCSHWRGIRICKCCDLTRVISHHITTASSH